MIMPFTPNNLFVLHGIVQTCGNPQIFNLHPLDIFHTQSHEVHSKFFFLDEFWDADDEFQARGHCPRKADFSHRRSPIFTKESKEIRYVGPSHDSFDTYTPLMDTFCRELFH